MPEADTRGRHTACDSTHRRAAEATRAENVAFGAAVLQGHQRVYKGVENQTSHVRTARLSNKCGHSDSNALGGLASKSDEKGIEESHLGTPERHLRAIVLDHFFVRPTSYMVGQRRRKRLPLNLNASNITLYGAC